MICRLFDLNEMDMQLYRMLAKQSYCARTLANSVGKDRSTVHRSLQRLVSSGLCKRLCRPIDGGGRFFIYEAVPPSIVKHRILLCIDAWHENMQEALTHFIDEFYGTESNYS